MKKTLVSLLLVLCILSSVFGALAAQETSIAYIQKYGNLVLNLYGSDLLKDGYTYGDIVTVEIGNYVLAKFNTLNKMCNNMLTSACRS